MRNYMQINEWEVGSYFRPIKIEHQLRCYSGGASSSSGTTTPQLTPQQMLGLYNQALPSALATTVNQAVPTATTLAGSAYAANPIYTASDLSQLAGYAPAMTTAGNQLFGQQLGQQLGMLYGAGAPLSGIGNALVAATNPAQAAANTQATNLLNSFNMNGLSGAEQEAVERSLNQSNYATGNLGLDNATNIVANAMGFGQALQAKRAALGSALGTASTVSGAQNTVFNPFTAFSSFGNPASNFGMTQFNPNQSMSTLTSPLSFGSSFGNQLAGISAASKGTTTSGSAQGGLCYLTTVMCEHKGLPDDCEELQILRWFRDNIVPKAMTEEYYKIAPEIASKIKDKPEALDYVESAISKCIDHIKQGCYGSAITEYKLMTINLKRQYVSS